MKLESTLASWMSDVLHGLRLGLRRPFFSLAVVALLALGIGATTTIFSFVDGVLLSDLPYPEPERLIRVRTHHKGRVNQTNSAANFLDYREQIESVESVTIYQYRQWHLGDTTEPRYVLGAVTSHEFFEVMGVRPVLGRAFNVADEQPDADVVVISHGFWQSHFGGRPDVVGQPVSLDARPFVVVGVMPTGFQFPNREVEMWQPLWVDTTGPNYRGDHNLFVVARLAESAALAEAQREFIAYGERMVKEYPENYKTFQFGVSAVSLQTSTVGDVRTPLLILFVAVVFVLLIACANVANLLLVQCETREHELAVRSALGASRSRIIRQMMAECMVLAVGGGLIGLLFTKLGLGALLIFASDTVPRADNVHLDLRVLAFATIVSILAGLLAGVLPAVKTSVQRPSRGLCSGSRSVIPAANTVHRRALVIVEVALAVMLAIGAGLMMRTLAELRRVDVGFRTNNVITARITLPLDGYRNPAQVGVFFDSVVEEVKALPGVHAAGIAWRLPLATGYDNLSIVIEGREVETIGEAPTSHFQLASPGYFVALGLVPSQGRIFNDSDTVEAPIVAVVNEAFERLLLDGEHGVGSRIRLWGDGQPWAEVVGVVNDIRKMDLDADPRPTLYFSHAQLLRNDIPPEHYYARNARNMALVIHADSEPTALVSSVREIVRHADPSVPISSVRSMTEILTAATSDREFPASLLVVFACVALMLATVGVYGVVAFSAHRRVFEMGIRMALGAEPTDVRRLVVCQELLPVTIGVAVGLGGAVATTRSMQSLLYNVGPLDPGTLVVVPLVIAVATLVASYVPALRASRFDPAQVLRSN